MVDRTSMLGRYLDACVCFVCLCVLERERERERERVV